VRTAVTDDQGVYRIVDLRPGVYTVIFTLPGFGAFRREGVELTTGFTATVNADMKVGSLEETVTVSGAAPLVDTQNVNQQRVFNRTVTEQLPSSPTINQYATMIPGAVLTSGASAQDVGGSRGEFQTGFTIHGARAGDFQQLRDGMFWGTLVAAGNRMSSLNQTTVSGDCADERRDRGSRKRRSARQRGSPRRRQHLQRIVCGKFCQSIAAVGQP